MTTLKKKISEVSQIQTKLKTEVASLTGKIIILKETWKEFSILLRSLALNYASYGRKHQEESEMIGDYTKNSCFDEDFGKILRMMSDFSSSIGEFHTLQSLSLSEELQQKYEEFNTKINKCKAEFKQESLKLFEEVSELVSHVKSKQTVLEKLVRDKDDLSSQEVKSEPSPKNNQNDENGFELMKVKINNEIGRLEASLLKKTESIAEKQESLKTSNAKFEGIISTQENECMQNIEEIITKIILLSMSLSEFKISTWKKLNEALPFITLNDTQSATIFTPDEETLSGSQKRIEYLSYLKNYLSRVSDIEETFEKEYLLYKKKSGLFSKHENEINSNAMSMINELEQLLHLHNESSKFIRQNIVNPIEKMIKVQSSLNSSIRISIKKIAISFQKAEENHGLSNSQTLCLSPRSSPITSFIPKSPEKDKVSLKTVKNKEISVLIKDHISRELLYLSSIKTILSCLYDDALMFYKNIQEIQSKILNPDKNALPASIEKEKNEETLRLLKKHGRNDYILKNNENNSSEEEELERRFNIKEKEPLIATYLCAYADKILLQGKLYITASFLYFFSHFNSFTILGKDTIVKIKISDIQIIKKKKNVLIFDNSILVKTHKTNHFFTSFISRDEAFSIILRLLSLNQKKPLLNQVIPEFLVESREHMLGISAKLKEIKNPFGNMFPSWYFTDPAFNPALSLGITIQETFALFFSDESQGFMKEFLETSGNFDVSVTNWSKAPPDYFLKNSQNSWNHSASRTIKCTHMLKERLPLMPNHCELIEHQNIYFISEDKIVVDAEFEVNAPYGDYFRSYVRWALEGRENVTLQATYGIVFCKSTIFQSKIIKEGTKETILTLNETWLPLVRKTIQKKKGIEVIEPVLAKPSPKKPEIKWELWGVIFVLIIIIVKLYRKVSTLESELSKFHF